jgi:hypothetical protein
MEISAGWETTTEINEALAVQMVLWKKPEDALKQLTDNFSIENKIGITINPHWWPRLPILPFRVNIITK